MRTDEALKVQDMHDELMAQNEQLLAALKDVFALIDEGWLVRNTSEDHKPSFAMRQLSFVQRLAKAHAAIHKQGERS